MVRIMVQKTNDLGSLLLIDDDRHLLESMALWLREQGYQVDTAECLDSAIRQLSQRRFDLVVTDIRLHE
ncbi:MAG TPA: response regulator, partial [Pirellulaceae bacterium]